MESQLPAHLLEARDSRTLIPFVGAGVSMAVERVDGSRAFPSWEGLLEAAATKLEQEKRPKAALVRAHLAQPVPDTLEAARHAQAGLKGLWSDFLRDVFSVRRSEVDDGSLELARAVWGLGSNLVITTNYDNVLRWTCPDADDLRRWDISAPADQVAALRGRLSGPTLWHLHGSLDDTSRIILSPDGYERLYPSGGEAEASYKAALETLRQLMVAKTMLFVGFSLADTYLKRQLEWLDKTFGGNGGPHYVIGRKDELAQLRANIGHLDVWPVEVEDYADIPRLLRQLAPSPPAPTPPTTESSASAEKQPDPAPPRAVAMSTKPNPVHRAQTPAAGGVDVLILCALKDELAALKQVGTKTDRLEDWTEVPGTDPYWTTVFAGKHGPVRVAAARPTKMGGRATASLAERLIPKIQPASLAMCGVCAGHPEDTDRGDVVLADRVFQHDFGKRKLSGFQADLWVHASNKAWLYAAQELEGSAKPLPGYGDPDEKTARWWFLDKLLPVEIGEDEFVVHDPLKSVGMRRYIPDPGRDAFLDRLEDELAEIELVGMKYALTDAGTKAIQRHLVRAPLVTACPYHVLVGPIGSGNAVEAAGDVWGQVSGNGMRKTLGIEMEAAAIGEVAGEHGLRFAVAKGVMDHADVKKSDRYKAFAARNSAEVLMHFLRKVVTPRAPRSRTTTTTSAEQDSDEGPRAPLFEGPNQVSADKVPYFTGREHELAELERLLVDEEIETVCVVAAGKGGIGKTSLAQHFVATRARELFPDGVVWLDGTNLVGELGRLCAHFDLGEAGRRALPLDAIALLRPSSTPSACSSSSTCRQTRQPRRRPT